MVKLKTQLTIENRLQDLRKAQGLTQEELGHHIDVTRATINAIEKGDYNPSLELAFRLARYFKTDIQEIFYVSKKRED